MTNDRLLTTNDRLLTSREVATILNVPVSTLDYWAYRMAHGYANDGPPFAKLGRVRRYSESGVLAYREARFAEQEQEAAARAR